jgi:hypothetical protein
MESNKEKAINLIGMEVGKANMILQLTHTRLELN